MKRSYVHEFELNQYSNLMRISGYVHTKPDKFENATFLSG